MATTLETLARRTRRFVGGYPLAQDILAVSLADTGTVVTCTDTSLYPASGRTVIEIGIEALLVRSVSSTSLTVTRAFAGTGAVSYAAGTAILVDPPFLTGEIADAVSSAVQEMYPYIYKPVLDTSLASDDVTYEFTIPSTIRHLSRVELLTTGDTAYRQLDDWDVRRAATPLLKFRRPPVAGTLRLHGFGPFDFIVNLTDEVDALFPPNAEQALVLGAAARLLASGEARRVRSDLGARDDRESATRPGSSLAAARDVERRFEKALARAAMPPLPVHVVKVM